MKQFALKPLALALCALGFSALPVSAGTIIYHFDQDQCTGGCGLASYGSVTLTDLAGGGVHVDVSLLGGSGLIDTGALTKHTMVFNLAGAPTIDISGLPNLWTYTGPTSFTPSSGAFGTFNYILDCNAACSSSAPWTSGLDFDITTTSITTASFIDGGTNTDTYFVADISNPNDGNAKTGRIGASYSGTTTSEVPEPFTMSLFGIGLAGMAGLRRRKSSIVSGATVA